MGSKQVVDVQKLSSALIEAARTNAEQIGLRRAAHYAALGMKLAPDAKTLTAVVLADARALEIVHARLDEADAALSIELSDDAKPMHSRDQCADDVRTRIVDFREGLRSNCGDLAVRSMGFLGDTPRDPDALLKLGRAVLGSVNDAPPKSTRKGVRFDARAALEGLDHALDTLAHANADVLREKREEQSARSARDEAWTVFDREHATALASLDAALRAARMSDIADRLRSSSRAQSPTPTEDPPVKPQP